MLIVSIIIIGYVPVVMAQYFDGFTKQSHFHPKRIPADDEKEMTNVRSGEMIYTLNKDKQDIRNDLLYKPPATSLTLGKGNSHFNNATKFGQHTRLLPIGSLMTLGDRKTGLDIRYSITRHHTSTSLNKQTSVKRSGHHRRVSNFQNPKWNGLDEYHSFNQHQASTYDKNLLTKRGGGGGAHKVCRKKPTTITKCMDRIVYGRKVRFCVYKKAFRCTSVDRFRNLFMIVV